jgi:hypothetical protein
MIPETQLPESESGPEVPGQRRSCGRRPGPGPSPPASPPDSMIINLKFPAQSWSSLRASPSDSDAASVSESDSARTRRTPRGRRGHDRHGYHAASNDDSCNELQVATNQPEFITPPSLASRRGRSLALTHCPALAGPPACIDWGLSVMLRNRG